VFFGGNLGEPVLNTPFGLRLAKVIGKVYPGDKFPLLRKRLVFFKRKSPFPEPITVKSQEKVTGPLKFPVATILWKQI